MGEAEEKKAGRSWRARDNGYFDFVIKREFTSFLSLSLSLSIYIYIYIFFFFFFFCSTVASVVLVFTRREFRVRVRPSVAPAKRGSKCKSWRARFKRIPLLIRLARIRLSESALLCTCRTGRPRRVETHSIMFRRGGQRDACARTHTWKVCLFSTGNGRGGGPVAADFWLLAERFPILRQIGFHCCRFTFHFGGLKRSVWPFPARLFNTK